MLSWAVAVILLAGCGYVVRLGLERVTGMRGADGLGWADVWLGLASAIAYAHIWSLVDRIRWPALVPLVAASALGWARAARSGGRPMRSRPSFVATAVAGVVGLLVLWLANLALEQPRAYDTGVYHLGAIGYIRSFATVPGLANLNIHLAADDGHFLYVALLDASPWGFAGFHLANGLLVAMLIADAGSRLVGVRARQLASLPFTRLASLLSVPAVLATALGSPSTRLSSPSIDLPVFVLFVVGLLYAAECLEGGFAPASAMAALAALSAATTTRLLYGAATLVAAGVLVLGSPAGAGGRVARSVIRRTALIGLVPVVIACGIAVRQAILSGMPLYPSTVATLHFDWTLPRALADKESRFVAAWARSAFHDPNRVLSSWHWFKPWLGNHARTLNTLGPALFLVAALPPATLLHRTVAPRCRERLRPLVGTLALCLVSLAIWFRVAPEPRFVYGPLWFTAIAVLAAILPGSVQPVASSLRATAAVGTVTIAALGVVVVNVVHGHAERLVHATGTGPLGSFEPPRSTLVAYATRSGLVLRHPVGDDRCWRALFCTPHGSVLVRRRGPDPGDGYAPIPSG